MQSYLDEHLLRAFSQRPPVNVKASSLKPRQLRRRMSCKGAIKKTRSINVDSEWGFAFARSNQSGCVRHSRFDSDQLPCQL